MITKRMSLWFICSLLFTLAKPVPSNSPYDPQVIYNVRGTDKYYTAPEHGMVISTQLTPYYQHTRKARNGEGRKVYVGDMHGKWNMFGLFFGRGGAPIAKPFNATNYPNLDRARTQISALSDGSAEDPAENPIAGIKYVTTADGATIADFTDEATFDPERDNVGYYEEVQAKYERYGLRGDISVLFKCGLGLRASAGATHYVQRPTFILNTTFREDAGLSHFNLDGEFVAATPPNEGAPDASAYFLYTNLLSDSKRNELLAELELDAKDVCSVNFEDMHLNLFWQHGFECRGKDDSINCLIAPYIALGLLLPSGIKKDVNKAFSITTGNNGFTGITLDTQLNLIFPKMLQFGVGGGLNASLERSSQMMPVPTSVFQSGVYPWKAQVKIQPGLLWYLNVSLQAEFIRYVRFYADYIFTDHLKDSLSICEQNTERAKLFADGIKRLENESCWRNQMVHLGGDYEVCPMLSLGFGLQACITGVRTYHLTSVMGTIRFTF